MIELNPNFKKYIYDMEFSQQRLQIFYHSSLTKYNMAMPSAADDVMVWAGRESL